MVEQKEPHPGRMAFADIEQPGTFEARCGLAVRMRDELEVPLPIYVDGMDDASRALFSDLPSPAFVLDREGRIVDKLPWADPAPLRRSLEQALAAAKVPETLTAAWTLDQRDAYARAELAHGDAAAARAWLDTEPEAAPNEPAGEAKPCVPPTLVAVARAALARAGAVDRNDTKELAARVAAARAALEQAWGSDPARLVAGLCELAAVAGAEAPGIRAAALQALDPRAPVRVRQWLEQQAKERGADGAQRGEGR
ncbi:MAG: hypothetical protein R3F56_16980 [Planctomycetota bacterium]